ncbi:hypothetical protein DFJ73DRAFT_821724 [Zopfochytrium polystomum]|nr:hypothetical protein DFJ73DRAFT_821724 [Zopfochytrium polystomum]
MSRSLNVDIMEGLMPTMRRSSSLMSKPPSGRSSASLPSHNSSKPSSSTRTISSVLPPDQPKVALAAEIPSLRRSASVPKSSLKPVATPSKRQSSPQLLRTPSSRSVSSPISTRSGKPGSPLRQSNDPSKQVPCRTGDKASAVSRPSVSQSSSAKIPLSSPSQRLRSSPSSSSDARDKSSVTPALIAAKNVVGYDTMNPEDLLQMLLRLSHIRLDRCGLSTITGLDRFQRITHLYLQHNEIAAISGLGGLSNLRFLSVADNRVRQISGLRNLSKLLFLDLSHNSIDEIDCCEF